METGAVYHLDHVHGGPVVGLVPHWLNHVFTRRAIENWDTVLRYKAFRDHVVDTDDSRLVLRYEFEKIPGARVMDRWQQLAKRLNAIAGRRWTKTYVCGTAQGTVRVTKKMAETVRTLSSMPRA